MEKLVNVLSKIRCKGSRVILIDQVNPEALLPPSDSRDFWTYQGSLTTPPLAESVTWIVFKKPMGMSAEQVIYAFNVSLITSKVKFHVYMFFQLKVMQKLLICEECPDSDDEDEFCIVKNFRPPVALGDRVVKTNKN